MLFKYYSLLLPLDFSKTTLCYIWIVWFIPIILVCPIVIIFHVFPHSIHIVPRYNFYPPLVCLDFALQLIPVCHGQRHLLSKLLSSQVPVDDYLVVKNIVIRQPSIAPPQVSHLRMSFLLFLLCNPVGSSVRSVLQLVFPMNCRLVNSWKENCYT